MQAKVELEGESFGGDRRAMSLARRAQERAEYAAAHPKAATPASWIAPATEGLNSGQLRESGCAVHYTLTSR
ncbi:MAG: hypothetical protein WDO12_11950 [Pseudomonadota bacterium]